eukprot:g1522.t1
MESNESATGENQPANVLNAEQQQFLQIANALFKQDHTAFDQLMTEVKRLRGMESDLKEKYDEERKELEESYEHVKKQLIKSQQRVGELEEEIEGMADILEETTRQHNEASQQLQLAAAAKEQEYAETIRKLETRLEEVAEFEKRKDEHEGRINALKQENMALEEKYEAQVAGLKTELQMQVQNTAAQLNAEIRKVKEQMQSKMRSELDDTTKATIEENVRLTTELQYQSSRIHRLVDENNDLNVKKRELTREVQTHEEMALDSAKRIRFYQKLYHRLQEAHEQDQEEKVRQEVKEMRRKVGEKKAVRGKGIRRQRNRKEPVAVPEESTVPIPSIDETEDSANVSRLSAATEALTLALEARLNEDKIDVTAIRARNHELSERSGSMASSGKVHDSIKPGRKLKGAHRAKSSARRMPTRPAQPPGVTQKSTWKYPKFVPPMAGSSMVV